MAFRSENEVDKFIYDDCIITEAKVTEKGATFSLEALIVKARNSQNSNYTDSYAGDTTLYMENARIEKAVKEGYKYYDANDVLVEDHPDEEIDIKSIDWNDMLSKVFLIGLEKEGDDTYYMRIELPETDPSKLVDTYEITMKATSAVFTWDKYMNRVQ